MAGGHCVHDRQRRHRYAGSHVAWHRLCGPRLFAMELECVATAARSSAGAQEWSGSERSTVHAMGVAARFAYGAHLGLSMRVVCEHEHAVRDLEVAWTTGLMYILSGLFVRRVRVEIITFSRAKS